MTRRRKPADPAIAAQQKLARKRVVDDLKARGVEVNHDEQFRIIGAHRPDVFSLLLSRKAITDVQFYAARRLEGAHALAYGHEKPEQTMDRVQSSTAGAPGQNVSQAMIDASAELATVYDTMGEQNAAIMQALIREQSAILTRWRDTVKRITGEANDKAQAALIRSACENLALAWRKLDYRARERRSAA